mgnify:CR=1 FL=1
MRFLRERLGSREQSRSEEQQRSERQTDRRHPRDAIADAARAVGSPLMERLDGKGGAKPADFADVLVAMDAAAKDAVRAQAVGVARGKLDAAAKIMHAKWAMAEETRQRATIAFMARPYPTSGLPIIPDVVSLDTADFGVAFSKNRPVWDLIVAALPVTLLINLIGMGILLNVSQHGSSEA